MLLTGLLGRGIHIKHRDVTSILQLRPGPMWEVATAPRLDSHRRQQHQQRLDQYNKWYVIKFAQNVHTPPEYSQGLKFNPSSGFSWSQVPIDIIETSWKILSKNIPRYCLQNRRGSLMVRWLAWWLEQFSLAHVAAHPAQSQRQMCSPCS
jgi:hypothetical protein